MTSKAAELAQLVNTGGGGGGSTISTRLLFTGTTTGRRLFWFKESADMVFTKMPDIAADVPGTVRAVTVHPSGNMVVVAHDTTPFVSAYAINVEAQTLTKLPNLPNLPTANARAAHFSPDGNYLIVGFDASPFCRFYSVSGTTFTNLTAPTLSGAPSFVQWNNHNTFPALCFVYQSLAAIGLYTRSGNTLGLLSLGGLDTTGLVNFNGCSWSDNKLIVTGNGTPSNSIQGWAWPSGAKLATDTVAKHLSGSTGNMRQCHFSAGGGMLFCGLSDSPRVSVRLVSESGLTNPLALDTNIPSGQVVAGVKDGVLSVEPNVTCSAVRVSHDGKYLATASASSEVGKSFMIHKLNGFMAGKLKHADINGAMCLDWWPRAEDM